MARAKFIHYISVIGRTDVGIAEHHRHGNTGGPALENAGKEGNFVRLLPGSRQLGLPRLSAVEFFLNLFFGDLQSRRKSVDNDAHGRTVRFSKSGDGEKTSKTTSGHSISPVSPAGAER